MDYVNQLVSAMQLDSLLEDATDFAHCNGMVIRTRERSDRSDICQTAPFALLPSPFPRRLFDQAMAVQQAMNLLYFKIACDGDFLMRAHADVVHHDEFIRHMVDCYQKTCANGGPRQKTQLLTQRADYMCHQEADGEPQLKQIEVNNIAVSMGGLAQRATLLHRRVLARLGVATAEIECRVPNNEPIELLAEGLFRAWQTLNEPRAAVLCVVENVNQNQLDQRFIEYELERLAPGIKILRISLTGAAERLRQDGDGHLRIDEYEHSIGLVYFRAGYSPDHYFTEREWEARLLIETSTAVKCPWIGLQLANTKKVQQVLATSGAVERFLGHSSDAAAVRATFAGLWGLEHEDDETRARIEDAITHPKLYVLKPQLEGGGGNFYGEDVAAKLRSFGRHARAAHILMQRVQPLVVQNYHVRAFEAPQLAATVSELGVYGYLIGDSATLDVAHNRSGGQILRSKAESVNEGGVAVGAAVIDTPYLY